MKVSKFSHLFLLLMASGGVAFALPGGYPNMDISSVSAQADKVTVKGVVVGVNGEPLIGVSILEKGTTNGTITDIDGNFILTASRSASLEVSYVGYKSCNHPKLAY